MKGSVPNCKSIIPGISNHSGTRDNQGKERHTNQILRASGESLVLGQVVEEMLDIRGERLDRRGCNEAVGFL